MLLYFCLCIYYILNKEYIKCDLIRNVRLKEWGRIRKMKKRDCVKKDNKKRTKARILQLIGPQILGDEKAFLIELLLPPNLINIF